MFKKIKLIEIYKYHIFTNIVKADTLHLLVSSDPFIWPRKHRERPCTHTLEYGFRSMSTNAYHPLSTSLLTSSCNEMVDCKHYRHHLNYIYKIFWAIYLLTIFSSLNRLSASAISALLFCDPTWPCWSLTLKILLEDASEDEELGISGFGTENVRRCTKTHTKSNIHCTSVI